MLQNYFKIAIRHLLRHKYYVLINIIGLGLGMAMCIVAYLNWKFDHDFDKFHTKADQLYRITTIKANTNQMYGLVPAPLKVVAKSNIAGVKDAVAVDIWGASVGVGDQAFYEDILFTESNFFDWFDFPLLKGEAKLDDLTTVLLTERAAKKYFGEKDPIGQQVTLYSEPARQRDLIVTGILQNPPKNSSIFFDFVINIKNQAFSNGEKPREEEWSTWNEAIFLALENPEDVKNISSQLNQYVKPHRSAQPDFNTKAYFLEPVSGMAAKATEIRWNGLMQGVPPSAVWGNIVMAILLLLTACLNFANMTVSLAGKRLKEIGIRKVVGGNQLQLIGQLLIESFVICLLGLGFGLIIAQWGVDAYNNMWVFLELKLSLLDNPPLLGFLLGTVLVTTLLAGAYPAFYISSFNPNMIFHGSVKFGGANLVSRLLLSLQIAISLIAIIVGLSFVRNAHFQQHTDLGFKRTGIQAVYTGNEQTFNVLNNAIKSNPQVIGTAGVRFHIGDSCPRYEFELKGEKHEAEFMEIGEDYLDLMEIKLVQGRSFDPAMTTDYEDAIMVNEKFVRDFFPNENPIGQVVTFSDTSNYKIIGVVRDFMQDSFFDPLRPLVLKFSKADRFLYLAIKTEEDDMLETRTALASIWKQNFPTKPFEHNFQNDFLANAMVVTNNIKSIMILFAVITLLLTITGLFALMSLNVLKRLKEIAVRRILGASTGNIAYLLNKNYFWIILLGIVLGSGFGAFLSFSLLNSIYDIHAGVSSIIMILSGVIAVLVVFLTIGLKLFQVMQTNPAEVLKKE